MAVPDSAEIVIVGGGITGVSIANNLAKQGQTDIVLLEKKQLASASTGRSAGVIETQFMTEFDVEIRAQAVAEFERLAQETRAEFNQVGYARLLMDPEEEETYRKSIRIQRRYGIDDARYVEGDELQELVPDMNTEDVHGAIFGPSDGYADPYTITQVYAERAQERGVDIRTGVEAETVVTRGGDIKAIETSDGRIECTSVVNAAGPWAPQFAEDVDLDLPAAPYRRQVLVAEPPADFELGYTVPMVMEYTPAGSKPGLYFRDEGGEQAMMGLHQEVSEDEQPADPDIYEKSHDQEFALDVFDLIDHRVPEFTDFKIANGWAGIYTITPDTEPIIDRHPDLPEYYIAAGFSGKGFQIGPMVGRIVADLILDGGTDTVSDLGPVALDRFE
ncbi:NAD(P)/FAD-dependent oxidoreductase [Natrinema sp. 74]|uniref:NAD(P)/FAD-dependent oxidoreductase n=1 Tax=Natrinema sp. 74 TaxID=3384159 RepID=UPI0038D5102E